MDEDRIRQLNARMAEMAEKARDAGAQIERIAAEVTSRNRAVTVTVGSGGILKSLRPGPSSSGSTAAQLCAAVMEAYGKAARQAAQDASQVMESITGRDTVAMQRMRAAMPPDEEEDA